MGITIHVRRHLYIETAPCSLHTCIIPSFSCITALRAMFSHTCVFSVLFCGFLFTRCNGIHFNQNRHYALIRRVIYWPQLKVILEYPDSLMFRTSSLETHQTRYTNNLVSAQNLMLKYILIITYMLPPNRVHNWNILYVNTETNRPSGDSVSQYVVCVCMIWNRFILNFNS